MAVQEGAAGRQPAQAGWFGKIPALGDFVARRLTPQFIEAWDHWLSIEILASRRKLGPDWSEAYGNAPTWRFALTPGVLDDGYWYGVLTPSVDRVGRHFPLTFVARSDTPNGATNRWWAALMATALQARAPDCDADALDAMLVSALRHEDTSPTQARREFGLESILPSGADGDSLWAPWEPDSRRFGPALRFQGLPREADFLRLIVP